MPEPYLDNTPYGYVTNFFVLPSQRNKGASATTWHTFREDDQWPWDSSPSAGHAVQSAQPSVFEHDS